MAVQLGNPEDVALMLYRGHAFHAQFQEFTVNALAIKLDQQHSIRATKRSDASPSTVSQTRLSFT